MRVCCYFTSGEPFYTRMTRTSIFQLRRYNKKIPIKVFVIGGGDFDLDGVEVIRKPYVDDYFCLCRRYMSECKEETVMHIDSDTFIFDDVEKLMDKYSDVDFAGTEDRWIISQEDWDDREYKKNFKSPVYNSGVTIWNNGKVKIWCENLIRSCERVKGMLSWMKKRKFYHRETFSIALTLDEYNLSNRVIDKSEVRNLMDMEDWHSWSEKNFYIYHCFSQNWSRLYKDLFNPKIKPRII